MITFLLLTSAVAFGLPGAVLLFGSYAVEGFSGDYDSPDAPDRKVHVEDWAVRGLCVLAVLKAAADVAAVIMLNGGA